MHYRSKTNLAISVAFAAAAGYACTNAPASRETKDGRPTFARDIAPILENSCLTCHRSDGVAPFALDSYQAAKDWAPAILDAVESRRMPPWAAHETDECEPRFGFKGDIRLTDDEIQMVRQWVEDDMPKGAAPYPVLSSVPAVPTLEQYDRALRPQNEWGTSGLQDEFRCFVLDPGFDKAKFVDAFEFVPGNETVVHHALLFLDANGASDALVGPDGSYPCVGGPGFNDTQVLLAWAPGAGAQMLPEKTAMLMRADAKMVLQIHYHPVGATEFDRSTVRIRTTNERPDYIAQILLIGNFPGPIGENTLGLDPNDGLLSGPGDRGDAPEFVIPAGAEAHVETQRMTIPRTLGGLPIPPLRLFGLGTHMHYVGTDMRIRIERPEARGPEPKSECLIQTPEWDFEWQRAYHYDVPVHQAPEIRPGDVVHLECTFDNSMNNPGVAAALAEQGLEAPIDVQLGDETLDEMCLGVLGIAYQNPF